MANNFHIRQAITADIPALAHLHVVAWRATYENILNGSDLDTPTFEIRERQWINAFKSLDRSWFCFVVEDGDTLVGFVKGIPSAHPEFLGELNKIYLLQNYQGRGIGTKLMGTTAKQFLDRGVTSMLLHAEPRNLACRFFEKLGGEKIYSDKNQFHGSYGWKDLEKLAFTCL